MPPWQDCQAIFRPTAGAIIRNSAINLLNCKELASQLSVSPCLRGKTAKAIFCPTAGATIRNSSINLLNCKELASQFSVSPRLRGQHR